MTRNIGVCALTALTPSRACERRHCRSVRKQSMLLKRAGNNNLGPSPPGSASHDDPQHSLVQEIIVSRRQEGNPLLKYIRNVRWKYGEIIPDYQLGATACAIFISLRFHLLKPEYVHHRIRQLQHSFRLRLLLCHVAVADVVECLGQVVKAAVLNECTLVCAFSTEECARYLETVKSFETKSADAIQGRAEEDYLSRLNAAMTTVRGVNRTDVLTLGRAFGSVAGTMRASMTRMATCPGVGPSKVRRLYETFHEPFRRKIPRSNDLATENLIGPTAQFAVDTAAELGSDGDSAEEPDTWD